MAKQSHRQGISHSHGRSHSHSIAWSKPQRACRSQHHKSSHLNQQLASAKSFGHNGSFAWFHIFLCANDNAFCLFVYAKEKHTILFPVTEKSMAYKTNKNFTKIISAQQQKLQTYD
jgi:hypothetical protein